MESFEFIAGCIIGDGREPWDEFHNCKGSTIVVRPGKKIAFWKLSTGTWDREAPDTPYSGNTLDGATVVFNSLDKNT